jgi:hypothetical protein
MVILNQVDPETSIVAGHGKPKVEWVDAGNTWETDDQNNLIVRSFGPGEKIAEFAAGEWIGVKKYSRDEAIADELMNDPRVKEIMAEKLSRSLKRK